MKLSAAIRKLKDIYNAIGELDVVVGDIPIVDIETGAGCCILIPASRYIDPASITTRVFRNDPAITDE